MTRSWGLAALAAAARTVLVAEATIPHINIEQIDEVFLLQTVKKLQAIKESSCNGKLDIVMIVDESSTVCWDDTFTILASSRIMPAMARIPCRDSCVLPPGLGKITYKGKELMKYEAQAAFMWDVVDSMHLGPNDVHLAIVGFNAGWVGELNPQWGEGPHLMQDWTYDKTLLFDAIDSLSCAAASYPHYGFKMAQDVLTRGRHDATRIAFVLLGNTPDGGPWDTAADALKADADVIAVGYAGGADPVVIHRIATDDDHAFTSYDLDSVSALLASKKDVLLCKPACEETATCEIFEDPHVFGFDDRRKGPVSSLLATSSSVHRSRSFDGHPLNVDLFETGDFWLIRSKSVKVQGRVRRSGAFKPDRPALVAVAIGGPFLKGYTLQVGSLSSRLLWNGRPVRHGNFTVGYPNGTVGFRHRKSHHKKHHRKHHFEANFSSGFRVIVDRFPEHVNVKFITKKIEGGMDGECGNYNKRHADDVREAVVKRMGGSLRVPKAEQMIKLRFKREYKWRTKSAAKRRQKVHDIAMVSKHFASAHKQAVLLDKNATEGKPQRNSSAWVRDFLLARRAGSASEQRTPHKGAEAAHIASLGS